jgi:S1-C subfamily serine protease
VSELGLYCVNSAGQVVVTSVEARSGAQAAGLAAGDVILDVDGTNLTDAGGLKSLVSGRSTVLLQVARGSQKFFATVAVAPQFEMRRR